MVRPVERPEAPSRPPLTEKVQQSRQSDPDAKRQFAQHLQAERSKQRERVEEPIVQDEVLIGEESDPESPEGEKRHTRGERGDEEEMTDDDRSEGKIDFRV